MIVPIPIALAVGIGTHLRDKYFDPGKSVNAERGPKTGDDDRVITSDASPVRDDTTKRQAIPPVLGREPHRGASLPGVRKPG